MERRCWKLMAPDAVHTTNDPLWWDWGASKAGAKVVSRLLPRGSDADSSGEWGTLGRISNGIRLQDEGTEDARGWPWLAMWCEIKHAPVYGDPAVVRGGLRVPTTGTGLGDARCVPLRPIWTGFLLDTAFYGAIWAMFLVGVPTGKRAARRKIGRCVRCGYDLQHDLAAGCPECGWNKDPKLPP